MATAKTSNIDLVVRLREACDGHPHAKIAWPHRILHEAAEEIERLRSTLSERGKQVDHATFELIDAVIALLEKHAEAIYDLEGFDRVSMAIHNHPASHIDTDKRPAAVSAIAPITGEITGNRAKREEPSMLDSTPDFHDFAARHPEWCSGTTLVKMRAAFDAGRSTISTSTPSSSADTVRLNVAQGLWDMACHGGNADHSDRKKLLYKAAELLRESVQSATGDKERLDWLEKREEGFANIDRITSVNGKFNAKSSLREAIDAAMDRTGA